MTPLEKAVSLLRAHGGNVQAVARDMEISRSTVWHMLSRANIRYPKMAGSARGTQETALVLPKKGQVKRYICTSAQNNTRLNEKLWTNLLALRDHYKAELLVSTFTYNKSGFNRQTVKRETIKPGDFDQNLWYDDKLVPYLCDERRALGAGLVFCGEFNCLPTAADPLCGLQSYSGRKSAIFPHTRQEMRSVASMPGDPVKFNYSTGCVTLMNYLQRTAGLKAEHAHIYGALVVEVNHKGHWFVRQLDADKEGTIYDLDLCVSDGKVKSTVVESLTPGDIHATEVDEVVHELTTGEDGIIDTLKPEHIFLHDLIEGTSINHHQASDPHAKYSAFLRGYASVENELAQTANILRSYCRDWATTVVVCSNHDLWLNRWLREHNYATDPVNAVIFLELQLQVYQAIRDHDDRFQLVEAAMRRFKQTPKDAIFLHEDETYKTCGGRIENGLHGHLGVNGSRGSPRALAPLGRKSIIGHSHSAGIFGGLYVTGTSSKLDLGYNNGMSSWSHSMVVTHKNGKRQVITIYDGKWRL